MIAIKASHKFICSACLKSSNQRNAVSSASKVTEARLPLSDLSYLNAQVKETGMKPANGPTEFFVPIDVMEHLAAFSCTVPVD